MPRFMKRDKAFSLCKQCSERVFGYDDRNMAGLGEKVQVLCESCGLIYVNNKGECMSDCRRHHRLGGDPQLELKM